VYCLDPNMNNCDRYGGCSCTEPGPVYVADEEALCGCDPGYVGDGVKVGLPHTQTTSRRARRLSALMAREQLMQNQDQMQNQASAGAGAAPRALQTSYGQGCTENPCWMED
jgi:hypothetical protein